MARSLRVVAACAPPALSLRAPSGLPMDTFLEDLARPERQDASRADCERGASLRIATAARPFVVHRETAETGNLHLFAAAQTFAQHRKDLFHCRLGLSV